MVSSGRGFHTLIAGCIPDCVAISSIQEAVEWSVWTFPTDREWRTWDIIFKTYRDQGPVWGMECFLYYKVSLEVK